jgi:hypothetical protein
MSPRTSLVLDFLHPKNASGFEEAKRDALEFNSGGFFFLSENAALEFILEGKRIFPTRFGTKQSIEGEASGTSYIITSSLLKC